eukprot:1063554-Pyramimonas_sp.AAC.1
MVRAFSTTSCFDPLAPGALLASWPGRDEVGSWERSLAEGEVAGLLAAPYLPSWRDQGHTARSQARPWGCDRCSQREGEE